MTKQEILQLAIEKYGSRIALAREASVSRSHISNICNGRDISKIGIKLADFIANAAAENDTDRNKYFYILLH